MLYCLIFLRQNAHTHTHMRQAFAVIMHKKLQQKLGRERTKREMAQFCTRISHFLYARGTNTPQGGHKNEFDFVYI